MATDEEEGIDVLVTNVAADEVNQAENTKPVEWPNDIRAERLNGNIQLSYHQTSKANAEKIFREKKMMRGTTGLVGGGIYFCKSIDLTHKKARRRGYAVIADVKLGRVKKVPAAGDSSITYRSLQKEGYDSVMVSRSNGEELVVYNYDQVQVKGITPIENLSSNS